MRQVWLSQESELGLVYKCHHEIVTYGIRSCRSEVLVVQLLSLQVRMQGACVYVFLGRPPSLLVAEPGQETLCRALRPDHFLAIFFGI